MSQEGSSFLVHQQKGEQTPLLVSQQQTESSSTTSHLAPSRKWRYCVLASIAILVLFALYYHDVTLMNHHQSGVRMSSLNEDTLLNYKSSKCDKDKRNKDSVLQLVDEISFKNLFQDIKEQKKFEASSVIMVNETVYSICDSSWAISKFSYPFQSFGPENIQLGDPNRDDEDSGYEALAYDNGIFYALRESILLDNEEYHAIVEELNVTAQDYSILATCETEFEFEGDSKGFEGGIFIHDLDGNLLLLGLCEGNHCSEKRKKDKGNGRLIVMSKIHLEDGSCQWKTLKKIKIPKSADFEDYSAITMDPETGRVAISSQEESQIFIGILQGRTMEGLWDVEELKFDKSVGDLYSFPKNKKCKTVYCNIEGIHWINDGMLLAVSDRKKSSQPKKCGSKDESAHVFALPSHTTD